MPEAWDLVPPKEREVDEVVTFILFCEDSVNEPSYFRSLEVPGKVKINVVDGQLSSFKNIIKTLRYCENEGLLEVVDNRYQLRTGTTTHVWSVFDRDVEFEYENAIDPVESMRFSLSIQTAAEAGLNVAWSNDVFELWILLHFEDVAPGIWRHRTYIYERLTDIFKTLPDQSDEMLAITERDSFNYKMLLKRRAFFIQYVLPLLTPRREEAILRANTLQMAFGVHQPFHQCNPCTRVHHLVTSILSFS